MIRYLSYAFVLISRVGGQTGRNDVGRELQGAAGIGRSVLVTDLIGNLEHGFIVLVERIPVDRYAEAARIEPAHALVQELVTAHEQQSLEHALLRAALLQRIVRRSEEFLFGLSVCGLVSEVLPT